MDRDRACLLDILGSTRAIRSYVKGISRREFLVNQQVQDSVVRRIEIMGEATGRLSTTFREKHPDIPWVRIKGMRNRVIHGYDDIDMDIVMGHSGAGCSPSHPASRTSGPAGGGIAI